MKPFTKFLKEASEDKVKKGGDEAYEAFFEKKLKEWKVKSPEELSDKEKKRFFDEVDREWKADDEQKNESVNEGRFEQELLGIARSTMKKHGVEHVLISGEDNIVIDWDDDYQALVDVAYENLPSVSYIVARDGTVDKIGG